MNQKEIAQRQSTCEIPISIRSTTVEASRGLSDAPQRKDVQGGGSSNLSLLTKVG